MECLVDSEELVDIATANIQVQLFHMEQILNTYSGKRYHLRQNVAERYDLIEVKKLGKEYFLVNDVTKEEMFGWLKKHLKVVLTEDKVKKKC